MFIQYFAYIMAAQNVNLLIIFCPALCRMFHESVMSHYMYIITSIIQTVWERYN